MKIIENTSFMQAKSLLEVACDALLGWIKRRKVVFLLAKKNHLEGTKRESSSLKSTVGGVLLIDFQCVAAWHRAVSLRGFFFCLDAKEAKSQGPDRLLNAP